MEHWYLNVLVESSPDVDISVQPFRDRQGNPFTYATGSAWAIPQGAANPDAACAFAATMTAPATWVAAAQARADARAADNQPFTGIYTANRVADEQIFSEIYQPSGNTAFDEGVQTVLSVQDEAFAEPANPAGAEFRQAWQDAVNRVLNGEQTAQESLAQAQQEAQAALDDAWSR
jgi:multiple sugar transport system substrate-binding protein